MPGCVLRVGGAAFDVNSLLKQTKLAPCAVKRVGDKRLPTEQPLTKSSFNAIVSESESLAVQQQEAIKYLRQHAVELCQLSQASTVEYMTLDFGIYRRDALAQFDEFTAELVHLAAEFRMSLTLSQYAISEEEPS